MSDSRPSTSATSTAKNVLGSALQSCSCQPMTGFFRNGFCETGSMDRGSHVVCAQVTEQFLRYTKAQGNDLSAPVPAYDFPGLKPGDRWCLCALRWREAMEDGVAPPVILESTHEATLQVISIDELMNHARSL